MGGLNGQRGGKGGDSVVEEVVVVGSGRSAREADSQTRYSIPEDVDRLVRGPQLAGCRGALRDYLERRVMGPSQYGYVRSIQGWLDGLPSGPTGLFELDEESRASIIAGALNELLQCEDEAAEFRSARGKEGQIATLKSKVEYLIRRQQRNGDDTDSDPRGDGGGQEAGGGGDGAEGEPDLDSFIEG